MGKEYGLHFFLLFKCRDIFFVLDDIIYDCSMYIWPPKWLNVYCHKLYNVCLIVLFILLSISFSSYIVGLFLRDAWKYPSRTVNLSIFSTQIILYKEFPDSPVVRLCPRCWCSGSIPAQETKIPTSHVGGQKNNLYNMPELVYSLFSSNSKKSEIWSSTFITEFNKNIFNWHKV